MSLTAQHDLLPEGENLFAPSHWERTPSALEIAHYSAMLRDQSANETDRSRMIFGECLRQLMALGLPQGSARSMLGKWRSQAKDDALLIRLIRAAHDLRSPDPRAYVTKAITEAKKRTEKADGLLKSTWTLLGWERPQMTPSGPRYRQHARGQVWRDPYGSYSVLPAPDDEIPPTFEADPGIDPDALKHRAHA